LYSGGGLPSVLGNSVAKALRAASIERLMQGLFELTQALMRIDSTTGKEAEVCVFIGEWLEAHGYAVTRQTLGPDPRRANVLATFGTPKVVLTTHIDCVPPFIAPSETETEHRGRGACDAKGIAAAMAYAGEALKAKGMKDFGLLFVVSEETDSAGAKLFTSSGLHKDIRFLIDGEPTQNILARGHKGLLAFKVKRKGRPGHSAYPELFDSAVHKLMHDLDKLATMSLPTDANYGDTTVNVGRFEGGLAANVIAEHAEAEVVCRLAKPVRDLEPMIMGAFSEGSEIEVQTKSDPLAIHVPDGYASEIVRFGTDVPHLKPICPVLLVGPGSIHDAHTEHEHLLKKDQLAAVQLYVDLVERLSKEVHSSEEK
jgi:acetylornithine deacetylase